MSKWIAEFELEDGDTMPEHMNLEYKGARIDFHCKPLEQEPVIDKIRAEIIENSIEDYKYHGCGTDELIIETSDVLQIIDKYKGESEE